MIKKVMVIAAMFGALSACNTVAGMGKDVQSGGEKVQDVAQDVQKKMSFPVDRHRREKYFRSLRAGPISTISG